ASATMNDATTPITPGRKRRGSPLSVYKKRWGTTRIVQQGRWARKQRLNRRPALTGGVPRSSIRVPKIANSEARQKIPVPRRSFLWSLNETSGEILTHVGPTEFTPSANDRIVRSNDRGGFEQAPMEARPFIMARDGEYVVLSNPVKDGVA